MIDYNDDGNNRVQTNLEQPGKPGNMALSCKFRETLGKFRILLKIRENSGKTPGIYFRSLIFRFSN